LFFYGHLTGSFVLRLDGTAATAAVPTAMQRLGLDEIEQRAARLGAVHRRAAWRD
jgi:hypothetical protein